MANFDAPRGFKLYQMEGKLVRSREYKITAAKEIFEGDLLMRVPAGTVEPYVAGTAPAAGIPVGISTEYSAATKNDPIGVIDDPEATFVCQTADAYVAGDEGLNVDIAAAPVGDANLKRSGQEIDIATKAATATLPLKILGLAAKINDAPNDLGLNADVLVKINNVERGAGTVGIA